MNTRSENIFNPNSNNHLDVISILKEIPFFKELKRGELRLFAQIIYVRWYQKDEIIFSENDPGICMYIIYKGSVKIYKNSTFNGQEQLSTFTAGDFFGEHALMDEQPRSYSAIALEDCCLLVLLRPDLLRLINRNPRLGNKIMLILAQLVTTRLHQKDEELHQIKEKLTSLNFIK